MRTLRRTNAKNNDQRLNQSLVAVTKGTLLAIILSLMCILVLALIIKLANLDDTLIPPINQAIKIISIVIGSGYAAKNSRQRGWLKGSATGLLYILLGFLLFSLVDGGFSLNRIILSDSLMGIIVGGIGGIIGVNLR